jgi:hypothetical protein
MDEKCDPIKWAAGGYRDIEDDEDDDFRKEVIVEYIKYYQELLARGVDLSDRDEWQLDGDFFKGIATSTIIQFQD